MNATTTTTVVSVSKNIAIELTRDDDSIEAIVFIVVVILWYSLSAAFLLGMQTMGATEIVEDSIRHSSKVLNERFREKDNNESVLEELVDKRTREKLWGIYLGTSAQANDRITQADLLRVQNIRRQLVTIAKHNRDDQERVQFVNENSLINSNVGSSGVETSPVEHRLRDRRRSATNLQILEEWQEALSDIRVQENLPWKTQKLLIGRHLRRKRHFEDRSLRQRTLP